MNNHKSPGTNGFSADSHKVFWKQLDTFLLRAINAGFQNGELSITLQHGLIVCIPKENKSRNYLKKLATYNFIEYSIQYSIWIHCK